MKNVDIAVFEHGDVFIAPKHASRCGAQILSKWQLIRQGIKRLIIHLDPHPQFGRATELD